VKVEPNLKCEVVARRLWSCRALTVPITPTPVTTTPTKQPSTVASCESWGAANSDGVLASPFKKNGSGILGLLEGGKVPLWDRMDVRCRSAEIIRRIDATKSAGFDTSGHLQPCRPRFAGQELFAWNSTSASESWFFGKLVDKKQADGCQGLIRPVRNCNNLRNLNDARPAVIENIHNGVRTELIKQECTYSPDGRLVIENLAPIWQDKDGVQLLQHSPGIGVKGPEKETDWQNMVVALPDNGCLTGKSGSESECKMGGNPLNLGDTERAYIREANRLIGAIYGLTRDGKPGLAGITRGISLPGDKDRTVLTFDCVSLAKAVGVKKAKGTARKIWDEADELFDWTTLNKGNWSSVKQYLPLGSLIATKSHITVVVGYYERPGPGGGFFPIVVEAENNLSGVVRAKVEDTSEFAKGKERVLKP